MISIDGSAGEGGGQVLRTALGLSLVTGKPFEIRNIRAGRKKPGLMRQHLTSVQAATEIGNAEVTGAALGSDQLRFTPQEIRGGAFHYSIGTAGSCSLVCQAVLPGLLCGNGPTTVTLEGGTHNAMAPPFPFLEQSFLPLLRKMGAEVRVVLERPGFYPAGGGKMVMKVIPKGDLLPLDLGNRGDHDIEAEAICAGLPSHIGRRELAVCSKKLALAEGKTTLIHGEGYGPGNVLSLYVRSAGVVEVFTGFGEKSVSAEQVANRVVRQVRKYLQSDGAVGPYLADQLLIPMAMAGHGRMLTCKPSGHTLTNIETIKCFLEVTISVRQINPATYQIVVDSEPEKEQQGRERSALLLDVG